MILKKNMYKVNTISLLDDKEESVSKYYKLEFYLKRKRKKFKKLDDLISYEGDSKEKDKVNRQNKVT